MLTLALMLYLTRFYARAKIRAAAGWRFLRAAWHHWDRTAALAPSSRFLVAAMVAGVGQGVRVIVELGSGTGNVTEKLLASLPEDGRLFAVELDGPLLETVARRLPDPRVVPIHGSALDLPALLAAAGHVGPVDAVVSSLGMSLFDGVERDAILGGVLKVLRPGGVFVQFGYGLARFLVISRARGFLRFDLAAFLGRRFREVRRRRVLINLPPADVFVCRP